MKNQGIGNLTPGSCVPGIADKYDPFSNVRVATQRWGMNRVWGPTNMAEEDEDPCSKH